MKRLLLLIATPLFAVAPVVTCTGTDSEGITRGAQYIGPSYAQVNCSTDIVSQFSAIEYGTTSGAPYAYRTKTVSTGAADPAYSRTGMQIRMGLGGLAPGTTYYARARAHPNAANLTDVGYSAEFTFTTSAEPAVYPAFPTLPTEWAVPSIDTSGYIVVTLKRCSSGFPCANGAVPAAGVANEDTLQTIIDAVPYGTVIQAPLGLDVNVESVPGDGNRGYILTAKAVQAGKSGVDDPTHQYIVLETVGCNAGSNFPPQGSRIDETYIGKLAVFRATALASSHAQHFESKNITSHHYAIRCLNLEYPTRAAADVINPDSYLQAINVGKDNSPGISNRYFIFDRIYIPGTVGTRRVVGGIYCGAEYCAVLGSHIQTSIWWIYDIPSGTPTAGGTGNKTLTVPGSSAATFRQKSTDALQGCTSGATVVVAPAGATAGNFVFTLGASGCKFYYDTRSITLSSCTNCTGVGAASDPNSVIPNNEFGYFVGTSATTGALTITDIRNTESAYGPPLTSIAVESGAYNAGPMVVENSYIEAPGIGFYLDAGYGGPAYDTSGVIRRSWFNLRPRYQYNNASSDGYKYHNRQHLEWKRGNGWTVTGNRFSGQFAYQNEGPSIFISGRGIYTPQMGNTAANFLIRSNTISNAPAGWDCTNNANQYLDPVPPHNILFENNLFYAINAFEHSARGVGVLNNSYYTAYVACQDVIYRNNTHGLSLGIAPVISLLGGNDVRSGKLSMTDNIFYYSQGDTGCSRYGTVIDDTNYTGTAYPRIPAISGASTALAFDSEFAKLTGGTVSSNNAITNNLMIGGKCSVNSTTISDLDQTATTAMEADWKAGNLWTAGNTLALRETAAGFTSASTYDYSLLPTSQYARASANKFNPIGADLTALAYEQGQVQNISVAAGYQSVTARYLAPDRRACSLDVSSDSGTTWTRATDAGGAQQRTVSVTGLSASTAYAWRLLCYYAQTNDGRQWDNWPTSQVTAGSVTTGSTNTMTLSVEYNLSAISGATKARYTVYMADGTSTTTTCTSSPCSIAFTRSAVESRMEALSAADVVLVTGDRQAVTLQ